MDAVIPMTHVKFFWDVKVLYKYLDLQYSTTIISQGANEAQNI